MSIQQGDGTGPVIKKTSRMCGKCESQRIAGPTYSGANLRIGIFERDKLKYTCTNCSYYWFENCADAK